MPRPETATERRARQTSDAFRAWRRKYRALNREALNLARNLEIPLNEARQQLAQIAAKHGVMSCRL